MRISDAEDEPELELCVEFNGVRHEVRGGGGGHCGSVFNPYDRQQVINERARMCYLLLIASDCGLSHW